jgi:hypothetical protein
MRQRKTVLIEVLTIVIIGAFVSFVNTLWLKNILVNKIEEANRKYQ